MRPVSLLPPCVDHYVPLASFVRVVDAFVSSLDLAALGFNHTIEVLPVTLDTIQATYSGSMSGATEAVNAFGAERLRPAA